MNVEIDMSKAKNTSLAKRKGIYLLPNLLTMAALFSGFYAIVAGMHGNYDNAAIAVLVAMIFDGLDGRVARLVGASSEFGVQFDSLSDSICFGITPALVMYSWGLSSLGKIGWLAAFIFTATTCLRLARFNVSTSVSDKKFFQGLPCPPAAGLLASTVWLSVDIGIAGKNVSTLAALLTIMLAVLMFSNVKYYSFKDLDFRGNVPFVALPLIVLIFALVAWDPPKVLFSAGIIYVLSGPFMSLKGIYKQRPKKKAKATKNRANNKKTD